MPTCVVGDFVYPDFNETSGLVLLGTTGTTNCVEYVANDYGDVQGDADLKQDPTSTTERGEKTDLIFESTMETNNELDNYETENELAGFLHRSDTISAPEIAKCPVRVRLTPSGPSKVGGMWFRDPVPVVNGFETTFQFQISDHSKECTLHKDQYFSQKSHRTCAVRGADGFAFVIQLDERGTTALGHPSKSTGAQMGFGGDGGIENSLAIAFDTWQNQGFDYLGVDHVKIQSRGVLPNDALKEGLLGFPRAHQLADGVKHRAKVVYYTEVITKYLNKLVASDSIVPYLLDNGEQKRIGTLVVFLDDGIENDEPLMAMPINLSKLLNLPSDKAYVGFTSSTGRFYEKHDILAWHFCDQNPCDQGTMEAFDYHQQSKSYDSRLRKTGQGTGFGGDDKAQTFPLKHTNPDTTPVEMEIEHFSKSRNIGLATDASVQQPPATLY